MNFKKAIIDAFNCKDLKETKAFKKCLSLGKAYLSCDKNICTLGLCIDNNYVNGAIYTIQKDENEYKIMKHQKDEDDTPISAESSSDCLSLLTTCFCDFSFMI